ncbi:MAG: branched-chain amino acid ABC transporter permease [Azospirillaceae bacterium]
MAHAALPQAKVETSGPITALLLLATAFLVVFPFIGSSFYVQLGTKMMIYGIAAMSLNLLVGYTGLVSLGHAAFFGIAAYSLYLFTPSFTGAALYWSLPAAMAVAGLAALVIGGLSLRTKGIFFLMVTLAFGQMVFFLFHDTPIGGSPDGVFLNAPPSTALPGTGEIVNLTERYQLVEGERAAPYNLYFFTLIVMVLVYLFLRRLLASLFGRAIQGIRVNEHRMRALGFPVYRYKLAAFVIAGALAGLAGYLWAIEGGFVNPELAGWHLSAEILLMVILGGMGTLYGPILGALAFEGLRELSELVILWFLEATNAAGLTAADAARTASENYLLVEGAVIILIVMVLPHGLAGLLESLTERLRRRHRAAPVDAANGRAA